MVTSSYITAVHTVARKTKDAASWVCAHPFHALVGVGAIVVFGGGMVFWGKALQQRLYPAPKPCEKVVGYSGGGSQRFRLDLHGRSVPRVGPAFLTK